MLVLWLVALVGEVDEELRISLDGDVFDAKGIGNLEAGDEALVLLIQLRPDTSILHHAFISIFIALWAVITHYVTILMHILSYFTRFT